MKKDRLIGKFVEVQWDDAASFGGAWRRGDELKAMIDDDEFSHIVTVGHLLKRNSKRVLVAGSKSDHGAYSDLVEVPTGMVKRVRQLK
jgi:hypothetical protein